VDFEQDQLRQRLLGWSLTSAEIFPGLDIGRDLVIATGPNGIDLARVAGVDNLNQALTVALTTLLGSDIFNIQFGFDGLNALVEETNPILQRERIRVGIIQVLQKEPRVRQILDVKFEDGQLTSPVAGDRVLSVRVAFQAISADELTISL
jgi:hypothetical protein